ncbi:MAG: hypothetical protein KA717_10370 [Woronichinia naegeliana WA131]|jgi:hypothetical protein|uniref:Uncharacterized protein n=1 Tax=Woronichinia naegeliana WA131 TaxID=2824559 RepID=A0A977L023_9CYAN|nr:MAG: hypothetical protein KA717_10370 [Woronichinia naegeliana WA131]
MIVAIYGSYPNAEWEPLADIEAFKSTCREIGRYFAECRFGIVVTSEKETTADYYVVQGFIEVWNKRNDLPKKSERCLLVMATRTSDAFYRYTKENPSLFYWRKPPERTRLERHLVGLKECDLVVVIGGNDHTSNAASVTQQLLSKPLLPIGTFGGAASKFLQQMMMEKDEVLNGLISANHTNIFKILAELEVLRQREKQYEDRLKQYEQLFIETTQRNYPYTDEERNGLHFLRQTWKLKNEDIVQIEDRITTRIKQHYQEKIKQYQQNFLEVVKLENPLSENSRMNLEGLKKVLGLKNEDVTLVESEVISDIENGNKSGTSIALHNSAIYNIGSATFGNFAHNAQSNQSNSQNHEEIVMETSKFDFRSANVGNFAETVHGDQKSIQHIYAPEQKQTLTEAAFEIQRLIKQLEMTNPNATEAEQAAYVNNQTTPKLKQRVVAALQAGSEAAIEEFLDNPYVNVGKAVVKSWIKPG